ncbi:hypothetical protein [Sediminispirochaeta bajacaliforniensis]|uniref:hypothetical protein n=1 Tax=Sediminispirochaeta bajacaliforniensis TaxID=148 RepID=UPI0003765520|nr:hypothetical protein [Sediminispirochaeta bajacaliforniensis]
MFNDGLMDHLAKIRQQELLASARSSRPASRQGKGASFPGPITRAIALGMITLGIKLLRQEGKM